MTEREFWQFLECSWKEKGKAAQVSGVVDSPDPELKSHGQYIGGHALLPNDYDKIAEEEIVKMGKLLFDRKKYSKAPDRGLEIFAQIALDECEMWNE